jgi:hypothetical protein
VLLSDTVKERDASLRTLSSALSFKVAWRAGGILVCCGGAFKSELSDVLDLRLRFFRGVWFNMSTPRLDASWHFLAAGLGGCSGSTVSSSHLWMSMSSPGVALMEPSTGADRASRPVVGMWKNWSLHRCLGSDGVELPWYSIWGGAGATGESVGSPEEALVGDEDWCCGTGRAALEHITV